MLGSITLDWFARTENFEVTGTYRAGEELGSLTQKYPEAAFSLLDAEVATPASIEEVIKNADWVINAIGVIKPYIHDDNPVESQRAIKVNSLFPYALAKAAEKNQTRVIQIATDCVYSGDKGSYTESDPFDALDVYGKTKNLGEVYSDTMYHVRCSIIGPETKAHLSLMDWFLGQPKAAELNGYTNHQWNGVTTLQFARICQGIISADISIEHMQHIIPGNLITKANLLKAFAKEFDRSDITINSVEAPKVIDRTLQTNNQALNAQIWQAAGYEQPPTIEEMVTEVAAYNFPQKLEAK